MKAIELKNITKRFGKVTANDRINLSVEKGEILAVLGENGSGKTTLMNIISGIYFPDEGEIKINGETVQISSPKDAFKYGIGMVHQHFKLIDILTAAENIILGTDSGKRLNIKEAEKEIKQLTSKYGFEINPSEKVYNMSVSEKQTVEILKVLYRGAEILILDEPTAVLTPQETKKLFKILRNMKADGKSIIIITHKLNEVLEISDKTAVLRKGKYIDTVDTKDATEALLTEMMVGRKVSLNIKRDEPLNVKPKLELKNITCINDAGIKMLDDVSLEAKSGEILGIAGIAGCGQKELFEAAAGLKKIDSGTIIYYDDNNEKIDITSMNGDARDKNKVKIAFVPEDRLGMGLVGSMGITENMMLRSYKKKKGFFVDRTEPQKLAEELVKKLEISTPDTETPVSRLSGGNVQKVLVGREIAEKPSVLMLAYPVRGLDIHSSYAIYDLMNEEKKRGAAVICIIEDLDVLIELCDRIAVLNGGRLAGIRDSRTVTKEEIGIMMTEKIKGDENNE